MIKKRILKTIGIVISLVLCVFLLTSCATLHEDTLFSTYYQLNVWGGGASSAIKVADARLRELEARLSPSISTSEVAKINAAEKDVPISVSEDTVYLMKNSEVLYEKTNGAYNPAIFPIVELWGFDPNNFTEHNTKVPSPEEIESTLSLCKFEFFVLDEVAKTVTKTVSGAKLDFGASAKGYACDEVRRKLPENPDFLVNIGGNVLVGSKSKTIAIRSPFNKEEYSKVLKFERFGASTAGSYERNFVIDSVTYHHIIGKDGYPSGITSENPAVSVSVIAAASVVADMLSTVGMLLPAEDFTKILSDYGACALVIYRDKSETMLNNFERFVQQ